jgi:hypothetical protein
MPPEHPPTPAPTPEPDPPTPEPTPDPVDPPLGAAGEKALEAMKIRARDAEKAAKTATAELDALRKAAMSDQDKAVAEAKDLGRKEATTEVASRLAAAEIKAALTGIVPDPASVVEDLNLARYIDDNGDINTEAVAALKAKYQEFATPSGKPPVPGVPTGARTGDPAVKQLTKADMAGMKPAEVTAAMQAGQFNEVLGRK